MEEEVVKGLRDWLEKTGLLHLKVGIEAWAEEPCSFSRVYYELSGSIGVRAGLSRKILF